MVVAVAHRGFPGQDQLAKNIVDNCISLPVMLAVAFDNSGLAGDEFGSRRVWLETSLPSLLEIWVWG